MLPSQGIATSKGWFLNFIVYIFCTGMEHWFVAGKRVFASCVDWNKVKMKGFAQEHNMLSSAAIKSTILQS